MPHQYSSAIFASFFIFYTTVFWSFPLSCFPLEIYIKFTDLFQETQQMYSYSCEPWVWVKLPLGVGSRMVCVCVCEENQRWWMANWRWKMNECPVVTGFISSKQARLVLLWLMFVLTWIWMEGNMLEVFALIV